MTRKETTPFDIKTYVKEKGELVNRFLTSYFERPDPSVPDTLVESMRYSLLAGGKRLRPVLAIASYEACGGRGEDMVGCAAALEAIHTYSLIHDDLPAMDNDDLRRGRPTNHKVFGEAIAILAGDGLMTEAFLMILDCEKQIAKEHLLEAMRELSLASGPRGMVGGQVQDILSENSEPDPDTLTYIHRHKTGALIRSSVRLGGILAGADRGTMSALTGYGENLGLAYQIVDDILDVMGDEEVLGKPVGSDEEKNKMTYPALYGVESSQEKAEELIEKALGHLAGFPEKAEPLREIARYIVRRSH
jgi:geranylgeranyl diphosphate synthase type II